MKLKKMKKALSGLFDLPDDERSASQEKMRKIIEKLQDKKDALKAKMQIAGEEDNTSEVYEDLEKEYKVVSKLLRKAKKNYQVDHQVDDGEVLED